MPQRRSNVIDYEKINAYIKHKNNKAKEEYNNNKYKEGGNKTDEAICKLKKVLTKKIL